MLSAFSKSQSKGIQMLIQQIYSRVLRALVLIVTLTILSSAFLKGDESSSPLNNQLAPLSWQVGVWKWTQLEGDVGNSGMVEIVSALNGEAIHHNGHGTFGGEFRFSVSVVYDDSRGVLVARGSNTQGEVWEDLVSVFEDKCVLRRTYINGKPVIKNDGTESEGIGVHTRIITQKKINEDLWEHSQVLILPSGKSEKRFVARLERVKE